MEAVMQWAQELAAVRTEIERVGVYGSYASGNWGVGSDVDVVIVVSNTDQPFELRAAGYDAIRLPVPADVVVYTAEEWERLKPERKWTATVRWIYRRRSTVTLDQPVDQSTNQPVS